MFHIKLSMYKKIKIVGVIWAMLLFCAVFAAEKVSAIESGVEVLLPPVIYATPNYEVNIYFAACVKTLHPKKFYYSVKCLKGRLETERWTFVPQESDLGEYDFEIEVYDDDRKIGEAHSVLRIVPQPHGGFSLKNFVIGDSLTYQDHYLRFVYEYLSHDSGSPLETIRKQFVSEARSGWNFRNFISNQQSPFVRDTDSGYVFDMKWYFEKKFGSDLPQNIIVFLGVNDCICMSMSSFPAYCDKCIAQLKILLDALHECSPNAKIGIATPPVEASQDAFGINYGNKLKKIDYHFNRFFYVNAVQTMIKTYQNNWLSVIPTAWGVDNECAYPCSDTLVNARSGSHKSMQNNALHLSSYGYQQIADVMVAWLYAQCEFSK